MEGELIYGGKNSYTEGEARHINFFLTSLILFIFISPKLIVLSRYARREVWRLSYWLIFAAICLFVFLLPFGTQLRWFCAKNSLKLQFFNASVKLWNCSGNIAATMYNMYVSMYECICMYILFYISLYLAGSLVSEGVGPWYCMLKGPGSNHLCVLRSFVQVLFSWGRGGWSY